MLQSMMSTPHVAEPEHRFLRSVNTTTHWLFNGPPLPLALVDFLKPVGLSHHLKFLFHRQNFLLHLVTHSLISLISILSPLYHVLENSSKHLTWKRYPPVTVRSLWILYFIYLYTYVILYIFFITLMVNGWPT